MIPRYPGTLGAITQTHPDPGDCDQLCSHSGLCCDWDLWVVPSLGVSLTASMQSLPGRESSLAGAQAQHIRCWSRPSSRPATGARQPLSDHQHCSDSDTRSRSQIMQQLIPDIITACPHTGGAQSPAHHSDNVMAHGPGHTSPRGNGIIKLLLSRKSI